MSGPAVVLDANTLVPIRLASTLLWLAEAGLFQPLWSDRILEEVERNLPKLGVAPKQAARRVGFMREAFGAEALVDGFDGVIEKMTCDPKDAHVLAAAIHDEADALVTFNLKDFPPESTEPYGIAVFHPDDFLLQMLDLSPAAVLAALRAGVEDLRRPPETITDWLAGLAATVPMFASRASASIGE
ncbi:PIN domain-containing protein [Actinomycetaceae bacterium L2_0104]